MAVAAQRLGKSTSAGVSWVLAHPAWSGVAAICAVIATSASFWPGQFFSGSPTDHPPVTSYIVQGSERVSPGGSIYRLQDQRAYEGNVYFRIAFALSEGVSFAEILSITVQIEPIDDGGLLASLDEALSSNQNAAYLGSSPTDQYLIRFNEAEISIGYFDSNGEITINNAVSDLLSASARTIDLSLEDRVSDHRPFAHFRLR